MVQILSSLKTLPKKVIFLALFIYFVSKVIIAVEKLEKKESNPTAFILDTLFAYIKVP